MDNRSTFPLAWPVAAKRACAAAPGAAPRSRPLAFALAIALGSAGGTAAATPAPMPNATFAGHAGDVAAPPRTQGALLWPVENCNDAGTGSLRYVAAHAADGDGIDLSSLTCSTISVTSGAITLGDVDLAGPGADALTIDGAGNQGRRIFDHVGHGGSLTIRDVTVHGAKYESDAGKGGACLRSDDGQLHVYDSVFDGCLAFAPTGTSGAVRGGAIAAYGSYVTLSHVTLSNNQARSANGDALGGALYVSGRTLISRSTISNNSATAAGSAAVRRGGGVFAHDSAVFWYSTLDGNLSQGIGGGALVEGGAGLMFSTVSNNTASGGGSGIAVLGARGSSSAFADVFASTISGNVTEASTQSGTGALYANTEVTTILGSTIAGNVEWNVQGIAWGAGILFGPAAGSGVTMVSTIVHGNRLRDTTVGTDIGGPLGATLAGDHNLIGSALVYLPADTIRSSDPLLGPLQDNGGPTLTRMPATDSPVIDSGNAQSQVYDQREYPRVVGLAADIGAVEVQSTDVIFADDFDG